MVPQNKSKTLEGGNNFAGNAVKFSSVTKEIYEPKKFTEKEFSGYIIDLCRMGRFKDAEVYYCKNLHYLLNSKMNIKEKMNHLIYLPRIIQSGGGSKHGVEKLRSKVASVEKALRGVSLPRGGGVIELGCGAHDPLALPSFFYLNGYEPVYGIDLLQPRNDYYSALSMYEICSHIRSFPKTYCRQGVEPAEILRRLNHFQLRHFENGNLFNGFGSAREKIKLLNEDICVANLPKNSFSLIVSFAVLEHVSDIANVCASLFDCLQPGGVVYHFVDLADHRSYRNDGSYGPLSFLTDITAPTNMNRLRAPQIVDAHRIAGFDILYDQRENIEMPAEILENLQDCFKAMPVQDLSVIKQSIVARKPG